MEQVGVRTPDLASFDWKIIKDINNMPYEVRDRFRAMKVLYDQTNDLALTEQSEMRDLLVKYEKLYQEVYKKRAAIIEGKTVESIDEAALIKEFDSRTTILTDGSFADVEVDMCDVKAFESTPRGVPSFWLKAMCMNKHVSAIVSERDREVLKYLKNVELDLHEKDFGFNLTFTFEQNGFFYETELKKVYVMKNSQECEKAIGCKITWTAGSDVTKTSKKIKKGKKVKKIEITKAQSFFNFFETHEMPSEDKAPKMVEVDGEYVEEKDPAIDLVEKDYQMGQTLSSELIPFVVETYLSVMTGGGDSDDDEQGDSDSDDDAPKLVKK